MPRKTKEPKEAKNENKIEKVVKKIVATKKTTNKKDTSTSKKVTNKKEPTTSKKSTNTKTSTIKTSSSSTSKTTKTKEKISTPTQKKKTVTRKVPTKKTTMKKATLSNKKVGIVEYYDLPYRYNQTIVKILAQTPTNLFIYWDISDKDRKNFENEYGNNFFETTKPVLIVYNDTLGYSFEVEINDFANSWYLHVSDSKCDYRIELGRRPIVKNEKLNTDYIYITTSNKIESPNDRILFNKIEKVVYFRDVKTGKQTEKQLPSISFIKNMEKIYNVYDLYKVIYQNENIEEMYDLSNPSSRNPSSKFK